MDQAHDPQPPAEGDGLRILIVEDHHDTLLVMTRLLRHSGYHVEGAGTVAQALAAAQANPYDVVISDLLLPDGSGLDLITQLRARAPVKAISLSGLGRAEDVKRSREAGFAFHLTKPIDFAKLQEFIRRVMSLPESPAASGSCSKPRNIEERMDIRAALKSQYHAALKTLREVIEKCPEEMWDHPAENTPPFWRVAYHTLFFTHLYLQKDEKAFTPWARHRDEAQYIGSVPRHGNRPPRPCEPFTRQELLEYESECDGMVDACVDALDLSAPQCGFPWYTMPTLEHQLVNIRHIQHHAAILSSRLRRSAGIAVNWVGKG